MTLTKVQENMLDATASQAEAEAGTENTKVMTALRVKQSIDTNAAAESIASQAEAEAGAENTKMMTALRTKQALDSQRALASQAEAEAGTNNTDMMTPLRVQQAIDALGHFAATLFHATHELSSGSAGGGFTSGSFQTRPLNVCRTDDLAYTIRSSDYQWTASGSGTNEYYCEAAGGGDPSLVEPNGAYENGAVLIIGTMGSLSTGEWDWGDNDTLGYSTVYVRLSDDTDPDSKAADYLTASMRGLNSNQITLQAGTYYAEARATAFDVDDHKLQLYDTTGTAALIVGDNARAAAGDDNFTPATLAGRFTLGVESVLELQHYCETTKATDGYGQACTFGVVEVYADVRIWKVA